MHCLYPSLACFDLLSPVQKVIGREPRLALNDSVDEIGLVLGAKGLGSIQGRASDGLDKR